MKIFLFAFLISSYTVASDKPFSNQDVKFQCQSGGYTINIISKDKELIASLSFQKDREIVQGTVGQIPIPDPNNKESQHIKSNNAFIYQHHFRYQFDYSELSFHLKDKKVTVYDLYDNDSAGIEGKDSYPVESHGFKIETQNGEDDHECQGDFISNLYLYNDI
ncbi:hypothetical protein [Marinomonas gallaica]|uniref:hypothetical protein n=1 Tax=Marinomonas gallaica TaxID=1806667 RepID=UPI003A9031C2